MSDTEAPVVQAQATGSTEVQASKKNEAKGKEEPSLWDGVSMKRHQADRTAWLITCVDLTSLMVGLFVLLFSTQTLKQDKWQQLSGSFQSQFASTPTVIPVVPDGGNNAVIRVTGSKSGLAYLDTLLHQRLQKDPVWDSLQVEMHGGQQEITYVLPAVALAGDGQADAALGRLAGAVRGWKNPIGIRVTTPKAQLAEVGPRAVALSAKLANSGVMSMFTDFDVDNKLSQAQVRLVVRAQ